MKWKIFVAIIFLLVQSSSAQIFSGVIEPGQENFQTNEKFIKHITILDQQKPLFVQIEKTNENFEDFDKVRSYQIEYNTTNKTRVEFGIGIDEYEKWDSWESYSSEGNMGAYSGDILREQGFGLQYFPGENQSSYYTSTFTLRENESKIYFIADKNIQEKVRLFENPETGFCNHMLRPEKDFQETDNCLEDSEYTFLTYKNFFYALILVIAIIASYMFLKKRRQPRSNLKYNRSIG